MNTPRFATALSFVASLAAACSAPSGTDAGHDVASDFTEAAADVPQDTPVPYYDAGPSPSCTQGTVVRHIADRPGGDTMDAPAGIVRTSAGFLVGFHHSEAGDAPDAGIPDAGPFVDRIETITVADDGTAGSAQLVFDGAARGLRVLGPAFVTSGDGALAMFDTTMGDPRDPGYDVQLRIAHVAANGTASAESTIRSRYDLPQVAVLSDAKLFTFGYSFGPSLDGGVVAARPVSMFLNPDGTDAHTPDLDLLSLVPSSIVGPALRAGDDGAYYLYREGQRLGFMRFDANGRLTGRQTYGVMGSMVPRIQGAGVVGDGIVVAWGNGDATHATVNALVASTDGVLRSTLELDAFDGESAPYASAIPAYGGVAIFWRRGQGANARLRYAVVAPDGRIRVPATDLAAAPNVEGRMALWASGREVAFVSADGTASNWGYTFGHLCLPAM